MTANPAEAHGGGGFIFDPATYRPEMLPPHRGATYELPTNPGREFEDPFDLDNLKFYAREDAENMVRELEGLDAQIRRRGGSELIVAVIGTGGTIAMVKEEGELVPRLDADALLDELPASKRGRFKAASIQLPRMVDSSLMPPDIIADTVLLMSATYDKMSESLCENFAGFLITHGTDTLAQSASLSRMMLGRHVPFNTGFVGAQKTIEESPNDVSANIDGALTTLHLAHADKGATHHFVFMNGTSGSAMNQTGIVKTSDSRIEAFESPLHEPLVDAGNFAVGGIRQLLVNFMRDRTKFKPLVVRGDVEVEVIYAQQGRNPDRDRNQVKSAGAEGSLEGVVIVTYGSFTFHVANFTAIQEEAARLSVPVFVANPFPSGSTEHNYGPAHRIRESGAVPVRMMPSALLAKIHIGRAMYADPKALIQFIGQDYVGEMPTSNVGR
jgi:L-asparaginase/Glu-tRNA(Gln) amidotransferase subunit D